MNRILLTLITFLVACGSGESPQPEEPAMDRRPISEVLASNAERLMAHEGIQGIYEGATEEGEPCLVIMALVPAEELEDVVSETLEGWPVRIETGDEIKPLN